MYNSAFHQRPLRLEGNEYSISMQAFLCTSPLTSKQAVASVGHSARPDAGSQQVCRKYSKTLYTQDKKEEIILRSHAWTQKHAGTQAISIYVPVIAQNCEDKS